MVVGLATEATENQCCTLVWEKKSHKAANWGGHLFGKRDWHIRLFGGNKKMLSLWKRRIRRGWRESWKGSEFQPQEGCAEAGGLGDVLVWGAGALSASSGHLV